MRQGNKGNTRVESLIVVGCVLAVLVLTWLVVRPFERVKLYRDEQRQEDVRHIYEALEGYRLTHDGAFPEGIDAVGGSYQMLGTASEGCDQSCSTVQTISACVHVDDALLEFLDEVPIDPTESQERTGYAVNQTAGGDLVVVACYPETTETISVGP